MTFEHLFQTATGRPPFPYQARLAACDALPDLLSVPTGAGKTAAAVLPWLWRRRYARAEVRDATPRRLVFCLPMRVLVEQTAGEVRRWVDQLGLADDVRVHTLLGGAVDDSWDTDPSRDAVLVGTQDQLLSRALNRGYGMSRFRWPVHFAWMNADCLWVMDETQLMGPGLSTSAQLQGLRERLGTLRAHTLWMSATLDARRLATVDFRTRPLTRIGLDGADRADPTLARRLSARKPLEAASVPFDDPAALAREILGAHRPGTRTLAVSNRVARAQALAQELRKAASHLDVRLVHARFRPHDRREAQRVALDPAFDGILVATQAIEAGVDVSAATLFTELASWSSLVQRFGRCNRYGERDAGEALVRWIDIPDDEAQPYTGASLSDARARLSTLRDVGPDALDRIVEPPQAPALPVLRQRDLMDLFDTTPDLSGHDIDVSMYIRDADDGGDCQVAWRQLPDGGPTPDQPALHRDELCRVRAGDLKKVELWRWDTLGGAWQRTTTAVPGQTYLIAASEGKYLPDLGWTGKRTPPVPPVPVAPGAPQDADDVDLDVPIGVYLTLHQHAEDTEHAMAELLARLGFDGPEASLLRRAARWHDLGKVHEVFQSALVAGLAEEDPRRAGGPWAKSDRVHGGRYARPHFRHELASALAALEHGEPDLLCYLVAAHHGKVRTTIRSRPTERPRGAERLALGVTDGDVLPAADLGGGLHVPATTLRLDVMDLGEPAGRAGWVTRVQGLLEELGPFRLAWLEALVRVADWDASRLREVSGGSDA